MKNAIYLNFFKWKLVVYLEHEKLLGCFHLIAGLDKYLFLFCIIAYIDFVRIITNKFQ